MKKIIVIIMSILFMLSAFACAKKRNPLGPVISTSTFTLTQTMTLTNTNTQSPTQSPTPGIDSSAYGFEDGTDNGWNYKYQGITQTANSAERSYCGTRSLKLLCDLSQGVTGEAGIFTNASPVDLSSKTVTAHLYAPADMPAGAKAIIIVKSGSGWAYQRSEEFVLTAGTWNTLVFDSSHIGYTAPASSPDLASVMQIAVGIVTTNSTWTGAFFVDCVTIASGTPLFSPTPTATISTSDTSTYGFEDGTVMGWNHMYLDVTQLANSTEQYNCGTKSLKVLCNFTSTAGGEAGINLSSPVDLDTKTITAYVYAPLNMPAGAKAYLCIKSTATYVFERGAYVNFTAGAWNKLTFDSSHPDYSAAGFNHTDVRQIAIKFESSAATWQGAFYIDCVNIAQGVSVGTPTATRTPLPTQTPTLTPTGSPTAVTTDGTQFGFEDGTDMSWNHFEDQFTSSVNSTVRAYKGTHSLALPTNFTGAAGGIVGINFASPADLTGKIVTAAVWVPSDIPSGSGAFIYAKTGAGWVWVSGMWCNLTPGTWNEVYLDFNNYSYAAGSVLQGQVMQLGIKIVPPSSFTGSYSSTCYIDAIDYNNAPATPTFTQTPSMTPVGATYTPTQTATAITNAPTDSRIQYFGRWDKSDPTNYRSDFGPVYIKINFTGTSCRIKLYDQSYNNSYQYSIDGGAYTMLLGNTNTAYTLASGLANTSHTLTFMRRTDATFGVTNFMGFEAAPGGTFALAAPSARPARRIEFIGDSITCGSGNEGTGGNSRTTENGYLAFGPQTAVALNAEWSLMSRGGLGAFRNWNEAKPPSEKHAIDYYVQTLYNYASPLYDFSTWTPDAVVVALGVNDFGDSPVRATPAEFEGAYSALISLIRSKYPNAHIFCMKAVPEWSANQTAMDASVTNVVNAKTTGGDTKIHVLNINDAGTLLPTANPNQYYIGDYTHPNVAGHALIAAKIAPQIQSVMGW